MIRHCAIMTSMLSCSFRGCHALRPALSRTPVTNSSPGHARSLFSLSRGYGADNDNMGHMPYKSTPGTSIWGWGASAAGQLGNIDTHTPHVPLPHRLHVSLPLPHHQGEEGKGKEDIGHAWHGVVAGDAFTAVWSTSETKEESVIYVTGESPYVHLNGLERYDKFVQQHPIPTIAKATCGRSHLGILTEKGEVYAWGSNHYGQLGNGEAMSRVMMPQPISFFAGMNIIDIASGTFHMLALTAEREVYSWGNGGNFILGHGDQRSKLTPTRVSALDNVPVQAVAAGLFHSIAIAEDGDVYVWGEGKRHQFGQSYFPKPAQPKPIRMFNLYDIASTDAALGGVVCGESHTHVWLENGEIISWGSNDSGQLGGTGEAVRVEQIQEGGRPCTDPFSFFLPSGLSDPVVQLSSHSAHTLALCKSGKIRVWGDGIDCQLGLGAREVVAGSSAQVQGCRYDIDDGEASTWTMFEPDGGYEEEAKEFSMAKGTHVAAGGSHSVVLVQ